MQVICIADDSRALVLEDDFDVRIPQFRSVLPAATIVRNPQMAVAALEARQYAIALLDFDCPCPEMTSGLHVARRLAEMGFAGIVVVHSSNRFGASLMMEVLQSGGVHCVRAEFGDLVIERKF